MQVMSIKFNDDEIELEAMQDALNEIGQEALTMTHHELAAATEFGPLSWRSFLTDPRVQEFLNMEITLMQNTGIIKLSKDIDSNTRSTGQAQLLSTLISKKDQSNKKEGPVFIYSHVPLNEEEQYAPNTESLQSNPFKTPFKNE